MYFFPKYLDPILTKTLNMPEPQRLNHTGNTYIARISKINEFYNI